MTQLYVYPETLRSKTDGGTGYPHVAFEMIKRALPESAKVHLYLPPGFSVPDGASYGNVDLGAVGANVGSVGSGANAKMALTKQEKEDITTFGLGKAASNFGADAIFTKDKIKDGIALNPNTTLQFDNVAIRSFNFTFKLVSESAEEAQQALVIENLFRKALYPKLNNNRGLFLEYPPTFKIKFYHGDKINTFMPQILESYLANITTTYNAGSNIFHADGSPTEIDMSLTFTETQSITRDKLYPDEISVNNPVDTEGFGLRSVVDQISDRFKSLLG